MVVTKGGDLFKEGLDNGGLIRRKRERDEYKLGVNWFVDEQCLNTLIKTLFICKFLGQNIESKCMRVLGDYSYFFCLEVSLVRLMLVPSTLDLTFIYFILL